MHSLKYVLSLLISSIALNSFLLTRSNNYDDGIQLLLFHLDALLFSLVHSIIFFGMTILSRRVIVGYF